MSTRLKTVALGLVACGLLVASAEASRRVFHHRVRLPGVNHHGNLDFDCGGHGPVKVIVNTHTHRFCAKANAHVRNKSGHRQRFHGQISVALSQIARRLNVNLNGISISKDEFCVSRGSHWHHHRARAKAIVCGHIRQNPRAA